MQSDFAIHFHIYFALISGLVLILIDYYRKRNSEQLLRILLTVTILFTIGTMISDLVYDISAGGTSGLMQVIIWISCSFFYNFQILSFGCMALFLKYCTRGDRVSLKKLGFIIGSLIMFYIILIHSNMFTHFIFTISHDGYYLRGDGYLILLVLSFLVLFVSFVNIILDHKYINHELFVLILVSVLPALTGSVIDLIIPGARYIRSGFFVSILFAYLFVIGKIVLIDSLTGIDNRRSYDEYQNSLMKSVRNRDYAFIMIDMDKLKEINDELGHAQGDGAIRDFAGVIRAALRRTDFFARIGGDEFVVIAATQNPAEIIERLKKAVTEFNLKKQRPYELEMSCGGDLYRVDEKRTPQEFFTYVDSLMYDNKKERQKQRGYTRS